MIDLISREAAIDAVKHAWAKGLEPSQYVEIVSSVDAVPVVHGRWERKDSLSCAIEYYCSVCGDRAPLGYMRQCAKTKYCPNCGAKMDGEQIKEVALDD